MDRTEIQALIVDIVVKHLAVPAEKVLIDTDFVNDLGADSLDAVEITMDLEETFGLDIPDEEAEGIRTLGHAVDYVTKALEVKSKREKNKVEVIVECQGFDAGQQCWGRSECPDRIDNVMERKCKCGGRRKTIGVLVEADLKKGGK